MVHRSLRYPKKKKHKTIFFQPGKNTIPIRKKGGIVGTIGFDSASPCRKPNQIKAQKRPKHPYMNISSSLISGLWASTPSSSRLPSLKRWSASDFPIDSLTIEEHILPQATYETAPKIINQSLRRKTRTSWLFKRKNG